MTNEGENSTTPENGKIPESNGNGNGKIRRKSILIINDTSDHDFMKSALDKFDMLIFPYQIFGKTEVFIFSTKENIVRKELGKVMAKKTELKASQMTLGGHYPGYKFTRFIVEDPPDPFALILNSECQ